MLGWGSVWVWILDNPLIIPAGVLVHRATRPQRHESAESLCVSLSVTVWTTCGSASGRAVAVGARLRVSFLADPFAEITHSPCAKLSRECVPCRPASAFEGCRPPATGNAYLLLPLPIAAAAADQLGTTHAQQRPTLPGMLLASKAVSASLPAYLQCIRAVT